MRPRHSSPTGTEIGPPSSMTGVPRTRPSVARHGDRAHLVAAQVLLHFRGQVDAVFAFRVDAQGVVDRGQVVRSELHVDDGADDLDDGTLFLVAHVYFKASEPPMISESSFVIWAWRALLYSRVRSVTISSALSVAIFIATRRASCSLATASARTE